MFENDIKEVHNYFDLKKNQGKVVELEYLKNLNWPSGEGKNIILMDEVAVELGSPRTGSLSFLMWTQDLKMINDNKISLIGRDLPDSVGKDLPFAKIVLSGVHGFNEENTYDRYKEMEGVRFNVDLKGYMMRAVSQFQREWSRVSIEAVKNNFSFKHIGSDLINRFKEKEYVDSTEIFFITASKNEARELKGISDRVGKLISAMNKMLEEMSFDCDTCNFVDICGEVEELREMRDSIEKVKGNINSL